MSQKTKNKTIAIAGGLGTLGFYLALKLSDTYNVIIGDNNLKKFNKNKKLINSNKIIFFKGDLSKEKDIKKFINFGIKSFKKIDYSINCCYPRNKSWNDDFENLKEISLNRNISDHLGGSIIYSQKFIKHFLKNKKGKLILISSIQGVAAPKFEHYKNLNMNSPIAYSAIKSGIIAITKYLAKYYGKKNIQVNCVSPGGINANQNKKFKVRYRKSCLSRVIRTRRYIFISIIFTVRKIKLYKWSKYNCR